MKNLGRHNAVGATVGILAHGAGDRYAWIANLYPYLGAGVLLRYRYWASPHIGIELGIGTPFASGRALGRVQVPSLVTELSLAYRGVIALTARVERTRYRQRYEGLAGVPGIGSGYPLGARPASWIVSVPDVDTAWYLGARIRSWPGALGIVATGILITINRVFYSS